MRTTPIPNPLPGPSPRIRSWRVSRASHNAPRPPKPHNLSHEPLLQDTRRALTKNLSFHTDSSAPNPVYFALPLSCERGALVPRLWVKEPNHLTGERKMNS